jgi:hypothetical protein
MIRNLPLPGSWTCTRWPTRETCQPAGTPIENPVRSWYQKNPAGSAPDPLLLLLPGGADAGLEGAAVPVLGCLAEWAVDAFVAAGEPIRWPGEPPARPPIAATSAAAPPIIPKIHRERGRLRRGNPPGAGSGAGDCPDGACRWGSSPGIRAGSRPVPSFTAICCGRVVAVIFSLALC